MFSWSSLPRPIIGLSPMADMTDTPFNLVCKAHGAPLIFKEMVSSEAVVRGNEKTIRMAMNEDGERPIIQQIFGSDPETMARAAAIIVERCGPDAIDINMGCPVNKLVSNFDGAALMKDPARAVEIVRAVKAVVSVPVSVKIRLGWSDDRECLDFSKRIEDAGADLVSVHGRTRAEGYSGSANWSRVGDVKAQLSIPVLVNGDIRCADDAKSALKASNADGMLIGRGALGNPWIFEALNATFFERSFSPPSREERIAEVLRHARLHIARYGERGIVSFRKHLAYYFKGEAGNKELRSALVRVSSLQELKEVLGVKDRT